MAAEYNIQESFARLQVQHFLAYLSGAGWESASEARADRLRFELEDGGESKYVLLLPKSDETPKCKVILQRAIYNLCGVEDRQPSEIIADVLSAEPAAPVAGATATGSAEQGGAVRVRLRNSHSAELSLKIASRSSGMSLMPGEAIEVLCKVGEDGSLGIDFGGSSVEIVDG